MESPSASIVCDGCGRPASPEHIAERVARLELATRFRPIHMDVLFIALAPMLRLEDDFYGPPQTRDYFASLMDALEIATLAAGAITESNPPGRDAAMLTEFQRHGYYMSYLSECPIPEGSRNASEIFSTLAPALIRRIRFNYKPKHIALLGNEMAPIAEILQKSGVGIFPFLQGGQPLVIPSPGDLSARTVFRTALGTVVSSGATA
jgi:hypothetical protein